MRGRGKAGRTGRGVAVQVHEVPVGGVVQQSGAGAPAAGGGA